MYECDSDNEVYQHIVEILKKDFPIREGYYCSNIADEIKKKYGIGTPNTLGLSAICLNEMDEIQAKIFVEKDKKRIKKEGLPCGNIILLEYFNKNALNVLRGFVFSDANDTKYCGLLFCYKPMANDDTNNKKAIDFELTKCEDGLYYYQFVW